MAGAAAAGRRLSELNGASQLAAVSVTSLDRMLVNGATLVGKAVPLPIVFELNRTTRDGLETRMVAAHKRLGGAKPRLGAYFGTEWLAADKRRDPLPPALDLAGLYAGLLAPLLPVVPRPGERLAQTAARVEHAAKLEREIAALEKRLRAEPQRAQAATVVRGRFDTPPPNALKINANLALDEVSRIVVAAVAQLRAP